MTSVRAEAAPGADPATAARRFPALDGLRAIAALVVFVHHLGFFTGATFNSRLGALFARLDVGVPIFFAISGFLLFRPQAAALLDDSALPERGRFWRKRVFRIFPAYWVILTVVFVVLRPEASRLAPLVEYPLHYLLLQIYPTDAFFEGISQAWSLAVELSFYLLLPFFGPLLRPLMRGLAISRRALRLLAFCGGLYALSLLWRVAVLGLDGSFRLMSWLPGTIDYFAIGMAVAVLTVWSERREVVVPVTDWLGRNALWWWVAASGILVFVAYQLELARGLDEAAWHAEVFRQFGYQAVALCVLIPSVFATGGAVRRILASRPLAFMGTISYSFYLWHTAIIEKYFDWTDRQLFLNWNEVSGADPVLLEIALATFVITAVLSWITYRLVEKPALEWSRRP